MSVVRIPRIKRILVEGVRDQSVVEIFMCKSDKVTADWRKFHNKELHDLFLYCQQTKETEIAVHVTHMGESLYQQ
jgi:hypothetical protein